jgi:ATP-dependent helicase HrpB
MFYWRIIGSSPVTRPVQVTENLALFRLEIDPKVNQQLQRKYPKHEWQ